MPEIKEENVVAKLQCVGYKSYIGQLHPPKGGCLSKWYYPLARQVDERPY